MDLLKQLVETNRAMNEDNMRRTIAHHCCIFGNLEMLKILVHCYGSTILSAKDLFDVNLTHLAARNGNLDILKYLHEAGALSSEPEKRYALTPLDLAISMKHWHCVEFLILHSSPNALNAALYTASSEGRLNLVKNLIEHGADIEHLNYDGVPSLIEAGYNNQIEVVRYLLEKGANVNSTTSYGSTVRLVKYYFRHIPYFS